MKMMAMKPPLCLQDQESFSSCTHYENLPMQYTEIFLSFKNRKFSAEIFFFLIFAQNIDCGYTLEPPRRGGSNE